ncbi:YkyA family protein [Sporosarcina sp. GW1-11]|uniref:YkyA family protein n=1 Tax=Sporosarcina sp. GW1-11 TaxID=2899126 RepID=UPI00294C274B|nr:YkyA family protein [Sporosarcina sp. GW1-11]MDV6376854.1 YkyA family protein [Sporosarcina sp. GW1-11]
MKKTFLVLSIFILLTACSKDSSLERRLAHLLANVNEKEKLGTSYVRKLNQREQKEQQLFSDTMELTQQQYTEVRKLVTALKKSANERMVIIDKEQQALRDARMELKYFQELMGGVDGEYIEKVEKVQNALLDRYDAHDRFVSDYKELINEQIILYTELEDRTIRLRVLDDQVNEVNRLTSVVERDLHEFNEATTEVNRLKSRVFASLEKIK